MQNNCWKVESYHKSCYSGWEKRSPILNQTITRFTLHY